MKYIHLIWSYVIAQNVTIMVQTYIYIYIILYAVVSRASAHSWVSTQLHISRLTSSAHSQVSTHVTCICFAHIMASAHHIALNDKHSAKTITKSFLMWHLQQRQHLR